jgi:alanyl-tRNA synthetase
MNSVLIRQKFLDFFRDKGHEVVASAPMVVKNDPTLMFTNAGMNQFKDIFLDNAPVRFKRIANTQKCLRVSGKHNDLEEVGHDGYHHTMFEMLGNWSFGDYFKKEAISWAWEFLSEVMKIDKERIYVTIFEGDAAENLDRDMESFDYWKSLIDTGHILTGNKKDNFWEMGDSGPCGPCSEIHVDLRADEDRKKKDGKALVNTGDPKVIEIWNLVFIQYNRKATGELELLPKKHVDTGMGFERLCMVLQHKTSNYDTDVFQPVIQEIALLTHVSYGNSKQTDIAMRVIADHLRAISFAIADGQLPSNAKAGYVIRRILRRAVRYNYTFLGQNRPMIYKLLSALTNSMGEAFPELKSQRQLIERVIFEEEQSFLHTLENGDKRLKESIALMKSEKKVEYLWVSI